MDNIFVYLVDMPETVSEMVVPCADGYTVYLNARLSHQRQIEAYLHAVNEHITNNDWEREDVQQIEATAHAIT